MRNRKPLVIVFVVFLVLVLPRVARADNCGDFSDCIRVIGAALAVLVGIAVFVALFLTPQGQLLLGLMGIIEAVTGKSLLTGEKLARWERVLGILPLGLLGKVGKMAEAGKDVKSSGRIIESLRKFRKEEKPIAEVLKGEGKKVEALAENHDVPGRKADALVDGVRTEFKTLDKGANSNTIKNAVNDSIKRGGQARNIIIDARGTGLTSTEGERGLMRVRGISRGKLDSVRVIGDDFDHILTSFK